MGRFINADIYISTGQGILGNNMFAYCNNNPVVHVDIAGNVPSRNDITTSQMMAYGACFAAFIIIIIRLQVDPSHPKSPNLPAYKKMQIDMAHVASGHMPDGSRNPDGKKTVFWGLTVQQVTKAIFEAYKTASKLQTQGDRIKLIGYSDSFKLTIEMWINVVEYIIETAYPK